MSLSRYFRWYKNPNNKVSYINISSNYPLNIIKSLSNSINNLLSRISSSNAIFINTKESYLKALDKSGYKIKPSYAKYNNISSNIENNDESRKNRKRRKRKNIWVNFRTKYSIAIT